MKTTRKTLGTLALGAGLLFGLAATSSAYTLTRNDPPPPFISSPGNTHSVATSSTSGVRRGAALRRKDMSAQQYAVRDALNQKRAEYRALMDAGDPRAQQVLNDIHVLMAQQRATR
jgi:Spy/CpxP family protein refolding chaperone